MLVPEQTQNAADHIIGSILLMGVLGLVSSLELQSTHFFLLLLNTYCLLEGENAHI